MPVVVIVWSLIIGFASGLGAQVVGDAIHDATHKDPQEVIIVHPEQHPTK